MHQLRKNNRGFTLIELMLAMSFVAVLLIFILTATLQITRIYNKGITLKQVNQSGAAMGNELQSSLKAADAPLKTASLDNNRLCLGTYSYVWNVKGATNNKYSGSDAGTTIGMVKVQDPDAAMCDGATDVPKAKSTELILGAQGTDGVQLQLRSLSVVQTASSANINFIYRVSYVVAVKDDADDPLIAATSDGEACKGGPGDEFCALNSFSFDVFVRKGGSGKVE